MDNTNAHFEVENLSWPADQDAITRIRHDVFILEQKVPADMEWDDLDESAFHFGVSEHPHAQNPCQSPRRLKGYARLLPSGKLTRMAVYSDHRKKGIGQALLLHALNRTSAMGIRELYLDAQISAQAFYEKFGFCTEGAVFMDAGIPHIRMTRHTDE